VLEQVELVAPTDAGVLIHGESGTGKELLARSIHERSRRSGRPMIRVNCASVPKELFESEFFGHVKGSFTGAIRDRIGRFELADGGTLFLDEVGEIPIDLQSKLLRVLQDREIRPVGGNHTVKVDVRIVTATNKDLDKEMEAGHFRRDLFYRLNVIPIHIPPLRERPEDIRPLAEALLVKHAGDDKPRRLSPAALERLMSSPWEGNARELENVIERALALSDGDVIEADDLPLGAEGRPADFCHPAKQPRGGEGRAQG